MRFARIRPLLEVVRIFLTPSAPADSFAGYALASALLGRGLWSPRLALLAAASIAAYWMGMATNDLIDRRRDLVSAPWRPIPSGRLSVRAAAVLSAALGAASLLAAGLLGVLLPALALIALILLYNAGGKNVPVVGSILMGSARAANLLLGAFAAEPGAWPPAETLLAALLLGAYIAGVTSVSRLEEGPREASPSARGAPLLLAAPSIAAAGWRSPWAWGIAALLTLLVLDALRSAAAAAASARLAAAARAAGGGPPPLHEPRGPHPAAILVRKALPGLFLIDAGAVAALSPPGAAVWGPCLAILALHATAWAAARWRVRQGGSGS